MSDRIVTVTARVPVALHLVISSAARKRRQYPGPFVGWLIEDYLRRRWVDPPPVSLPHQPPAVQRRRAIPSRGRRIRMDVQITDETASTMNALAQDERVSLNEYICGVVALRLQAKGKRAQRGPIESAVLSPKTDTPDGDEA